MSDAVSFGLSLPNRAVLFGMPTATLLKAAERAEQSGYFDSVWVGDNLLSKARLEAIVTLSAIAARTERVRLGTICLASFTLRDPLLLAIQWASLDVLSGGRTILAVCLGGSASKGAQFARELDAFGVASSERAGRLVEGVELLRRFWSSEPVDFDGRFYRFAGVEAWPKPLQARIPIVLAVNPPPGTAAPVEERALRRVARIADGWQTDGTPPELFRERWARVRAMAASEGRADHMRHASLHLMVNINDDAGAARAESVAFLDHYYGQGAVSDEKLNAWLAAGSPETVIARIEAFVEAGCTTPVLRFTADDQLGQLERCINQVLPAFAGRSVVGQ